MQASVGGHGGLARRAALLLALLLTGTGTFAANGIDDFRILYSESFAPAAPPAGTTLKPTDDPLLGGYPEAQLVVRVVLGDPIGTMVSV